MAEKKSAVPGREKPFKIEHSNPKLKDQVGETTQSAFDEVWSKRGWTRVDDRSSEATTPAVTQTKKEQV